MKVIFTFLFVLVLLSYALPAFSFSFTSDGRAGPSGNGYSSFLGKDALVLKTDTVSFGSLSGGGIIVLIDNPYSSSSVLPSFSLSSSSSVTGAALHLSSFTVFSFYGERDGLGLSYDGSAIDITLLYADAGEDEDFQKDRVRRTDTSSLWLALSYERKSLMKMTVLGSMSRPGQFSSLFSFSLILQSITVSYGMGRVQAFLDDGKPWYSSFSISVDDERFDIEHRVYLARSPVYLREYRDYEYRVKGRLKLGNLVISDTITKTFLSGKTEREEKTALSWRGITIGYSRSTDSLYASIEKGGVNAVLEKGKLTVTLTESFTAGAFTIRMRISSEGTVSWVVTYGETSGTDDSLESGDS